jgi:hypothetical protein
MNNTSVTRDPGVVSFDEWTLQACARGKSGATSVRNGA